MTQSQTERMAAEICSIERDGLDPSEVDARICAIVGDVTGPDFDDLMDRVVQIMAEKRAELARKAETLATIGRLSRATRCPDNVSPVTWLEGLGLIEPDGAGAYRLTAISRTRAV